MIRKYIIYLALLFPNIAFALSGSCSDTKLADYLMQEHNVIVSFKVINSQFSENPSENFIEIELTKEFFSNKIQNTHIRIDKENAFGPALNTFEKNIEWLTVLSKHNNAYSIAGCAPTLTIENEMVIGDTGIDILDTTNQAVSIEMFEIALNAFQQGISSADKVCKRSNSYCTGRATYDMNTGVLSLPSVEYTHFLGVRLYATATMKRVGESITTFAVTEIK